jgi:outer membrane protein OmpA-like peptidoglycan-associated protein
MRSSFKRFGLIAALSLLAFSSVAHAQLSSVEAERLQLNPNGMGSAFFGTGALLPQSRFRIIGAVGYQRDPLVVQLRSQRIGRVLRYRTTVHLGGAYAFTDWLELGALVPVVVQQRGDDLRSEDIAMPASSALGTPEVVARFGLLRQDGGAPLDVALELGAGLPIGAKDAFTKDSGWRWSPKLTGGMAVGGIVRLGAELGALLRKKVLLNPGGLLNDDEIGNELRAGVSLATLNEGPRGELGFRASKSLTESPDGLELLGGVRHAFAPWVEGYVLGAVGFGSQPTLPLFRLVAGVALGETSKVQPEKAPEPPPPPPAPPVAEAPKEPECVEGKPYELAQCPALDLDSDGFANAKDACPKEKGVAPEGCPAPPEPPKAEVKVEKDRLVIPEKIRFKVNSAALDPASFSVLNQIAETLEQHDEVKKVRIEGHTDSSGSVATNQKLSTLRAQSVRDYLLKKGIAKERLSSVGLGSDKPIAPNESVAGRELNRRVEFHIEGNSP